MQLLDLYVRFFKSFNYDYERKARGGGPPPAWEVTAEGWFPFVRVTLERDVTAVVGANESGKSHLLQAIESLLRGDGQSETDFCRYSPLFSVERGLRRLPEFGGGFETDDAESRQLKAISVPLASPGRLILVRRSAEDLAAVDSQGEPTVLNEAQSAAIEAMLPSSFKVERAVPVPDSIAIRALGTRGRPLWSRKTRNAIMDLVATAAEAEAIKSAAARLATVLADDDAEEPLSGVDLGRMLLLDLARIDPSTFDDLEDAIAHGKEGLVNGLIQKMNDAISRHLNLARWWTQDNDFTLRVSPREHELVFTIRDRTGTDYSFGERSTGLRYFLSYFVQLRAHEVSAPAAEILLMDEPDTYLSASGQQDLLRVIESYARPEVEGANRRVVYVTHSPFLVNRNAGHRIRVLDKGSGEEGTRVVKDATKNRYEPLRSSIGAFVAETAFIGGANLFVEGTSDQVLLVGLSNHLRKAGKPESSCLDLNAITVVAAGSASTVPYMLYLARAQDAVKPPCAVLLDSDQAGKAARAAILKGGAYRKALVPAENIALLGEWSDHADLDVARDVQVTDIEDLIPLRVALAAARNYAQTLLGVETAELQNITEGMIREGIADCHSVFDATEAAFRVAFDSKLEKIPFAKEVVAVVTTPTGGRAPDGVNALLKNFSGLIEHLAALLRTAVATELDSRRNNRVSRAIDAFLSDHPDGATRDRADLALREVEAAADDTPNGDQLRADVARLRRGYRLTQEPLRPVDEFAQYRVDLESLRYSDRLAYQDRAR